MFMKKSFVIRASKLKRGKLHIDYKTIVFFTLLLCGVILGTIISREGSLAWHSFFNTFVNNHLSAKATSSIFRNFSLVFICLFMIMVFNYISGLCGVGSIFLYLTPVLFGLYCGIIVCQYYYIYHLSGIVYCVLVNIPCYAITAATLIRCCRYSQDISKDILFYLINGRSEKQDSILYSYSISYLIMTIPIVIGSLLSAISFRLFSDLFEFI